MKKIKSLAAALLLTVISITAQENVDVKKETVTKKIVTKGTTVETTVVNDVKEERNVIRVEETETENQEATVVTESSNKTEVVVDTAVTNEANKAMIEEYQRAEQQEVQESIEIQRAEKKRMDSDVDAIKKANVEAQKEEKKTKKVKKKIDN